MTKSDPIVYSRPSQEKWDQMSDEEQERTLLLEAVDDIRKNTKTTRDVAVIFLVLTILGMVGVVIF